MQPAAFARQSDGLRYWENIYNPIPLNSNICLCYKEIWYGSTINLGIDLTETQLLASKLYPKAKLPRNNFKLG